MVWVKRRLTDGPGSRKGLRGGIKKILLRTGHLYWKESSDSREFNQYQVWCPGPAQPPFHWVTVNKPFFLSAPQVHLCEMNVGVSMFLTVLMLSNPGFRVRSGLLLILERAPAPACVCPRNAGALAVLPRFGASFL